MSDFSQALRGLRRSPALVAVAVLSLALGIGANVTVFSVVREMILDDLSARRPERLARVAGADISYTVYRDLRLAGPFEHLAYHRGLGNESGRRICFLCRRAPNARVWGPRGLGRVTIHHVRRHHWCAAVISCHSTLDRIDSRRRQPLGFRAGNRSRAAVACD